MHRHVLIAAAAAAYCATGKLTAKVKVKKKIKKLTIDSGKPTVAPSKTGVVSIKLSKAGLAALKKAKKLKAPLTLVVSRPDGSKVALVATLTLKAPKVTK